MACNSIFSVTTMSEAVEMFLPQNNLRTFISLHFGERALKWNPCNWISLQMEIPASSLINRYIACQGPLPNTCPDFWQMTWEQGSSMVVMLTTQVERGRVRRGILHRQGLETTFELQYVGQKCVQTKYLCCTCGIALNSSNLINTFLPVL